MCHQFIIQLFSHLYIFSLYKIMFFFCSCYNGLCFRLKDGSRAMAVPKKIAHPYWTVFASARTLQDNWPSRGLFRHRRFQFTDSFDLWWIRQKSLWRYDVSKIGQFCDHDFFVKADTFIACSCENSPLALVFFRSRTTKDQNAVKYDYNTA